MNKNHCYYSHQRSNFRVNTIPRACTFVLSSPFNSRLLRPQFLSFRQNPACQIWQSSNYLNAQSLTENDKQTLSLSLLFAAPRLDSRCTRIGYDSAIGISRFLTTDSLGGVARKRTETNTRGWRQFVTPWNSLQLVTSSLLLE